MVLTIYDKTGKARMSVSPNDSSTQEKEIQGDNVLTLSFTYLAYVALDVNDYCDFMGERYWLQERYTPKEENAGKWVYNLKLYGVESLIKRFLVLETTDGNADVGICSSCDVVDGQEGSKSQYDCRCYQCHGSHILDPVFGILFHMP